MKGTCFRADISRLGLLNYRSCSFLICAEQTIILYHATALNVKVHCDEYCAMDVVIRIWYTSVSSAVRHQPLQHQMQPCKQQQPQLGCPTSMAVLQYLTLLKTE